MELLGLVLREHISRLEGIYRFVNFDFEVNSCKKYHILPIECCIDMSVVLFLVNTETFFEAQFELSKIQRLSRYTEIYPQQKRKMISFLRLTRVG